MNKSKIGKRILGSLELPQTLRQTVVKVEEVINIYRNSYRGFTSISKLPPEKRAEKNFGKRLAHEIDDVASGKV